MTKFSSAPVIDNSIEHGRQPSISERLAGIGSVVANLEVASFDNSDKLDTRESDTINNMFELTDPESKTYFVGDDYTFLVHVPLGVVEARFTEIGTERSGVLMTSLINGGRQGTFQGEGGLLIRPKNDEAIVGVSEVDPGGEIAHSLIGPVEAVEKEAPNCEYNQIDVSFKGSEVVGVVIKVTPEGQELGNSMRNEDLKKLARIQDVPVATVVVEPDSLTTEIVTTKRKFSAESGLDTYDIPFGDDGFLRVDIAKGNFYHSESNLISRSRVIDQYGQASHKLSEEQIERIRSEMTKLSLDGKIRKEELKAAIEGIMLT